MTWSRAVAVTLAIFGVMALASKEASADPAEVEALIAQANDLRRAGKPWQAVTYYQKAFDLERNPRTAGQLGLGELDAGYPVQAVEHLTIALQSPNHSWVARYRAELEQTLAKARAQTGEITIEGTPVGATVAVNGRDVGNLPIGSRIRVVAGKVEIAVRAEGYVSFSKSLVLEGAGQQHLAVALGKLGSPTSAPSMPVPPATPTTAPVDAGTHDSDHPRTSLRRRIGWGAAIGSAAFLAAAIAETIVWQSKRHDFNDPKRGCFEDAPMRGQPGCSSLLDSAHTATGLAITGYVVSGALAITSAVLLLSETPTEAHVASTISCGPTGISPSLGCRVAF